MVKSQTIQNFNYIMNVQPWIGVCNSVRRSKPKIYNWKSQGIDDKGAMNPKSRNPDFASCVLELANGNMKLLISYGGL